MIPQILSRTSALSSTRDGAWLFAARVGDEHHVVWWRPGDAAYDVAASPVRLTRGLVGARFLSVTDTSVEVVTVVSA